MNRVYVRWYGRVLEGELLEGEHLGMKQVRIPLDGHHPVALFAPEHVYETEEAASVIAYPTKSPGDAIADLIKMHRELASKESVGGFMQNVINLQKLENFKAENWDQERNHLRIDALNDFYRLWRIAVAARYGVTTESPVPAASPAALVTADPPAPRPSRKQTPLVIQLSLFD